MDPRKALLIILGVVRTVDEKDQVLQVGNVKSEFYACLAAGLAMRVAILHLCVGCTA